MFTYLHREIRIPIITNHEYASQHPIPFLSDQMANVMPN